jgi:hypothetical protein
MAIDEKHPDYVERILDWAMMRDCDVGERAVKAKGTLYLPKPSGFAAQADGGNAMQAAYMTRARFPDWLAPTLKGMVGLIHRNEIQVDLPDGLLPIWERATKDGLPLEAFARRVTGEILKMGRYGILVDAPPADDTSIPPEYLGFPYLAGYSTEAIINWAPDRSLFVLDESGPRMEGFKWADLKKYRVLSRENGIYVQDEYLTVEEGSGTRIQIQAKGGTAMPEIPFVVIGPRDLSLSVEEPALIGVARAALSAYRLDADYRYQLFMTGQETFVVTGVDQDRLPTAIGAGVVLGLPEKATALYVGPKGVGIEAHRVAIADEREAAMAAGTRVFDTNTRPNTAESGDALRLRLTSQTTTLASVSQASAAGLERALRYAAIMIGADPEKVVVTPNVDFIGNKLTPSEVVDLVKGWQAGGYTYRTLYENLQKGGIASAERTAEEEQAEIEIEDPPGLKSMQVPVEEDERLNLGRT